MLSNVVESSKQKLNNINDQFWIIKFTHCIENSHFIESYKRINLLEYLELQKSL